MRSYTTTKTRKDEAEVKVSLNEFLVYYNLNIPSTFPKATVESLEKFRATHAGLFDENKQWSIEKHRKKFMDWLSSGVETF